MQAPPFDTSAASIIVHVSCATVPLRPSTHRQVKSIHAVTFTRTFVSVTVRVLKMNRLVGQLEKRRMWDMQGHTTEEATR
jgi:hypothetical protein